MEQESPKYGQRLLCHLIDERAEQHHERPYASIPLTAKISDGFRDVSYKEFANAINRAVYWLEESFGKTSSLEVVTYIGAPDIRYQILALAAAKTGHVMFFPSPRNPADALQRLIEQAGCTKIITSAAPSPPVQKVLDNRPMEQVHIPTTDFFLNPTPVPKVELTGTFTEYRKRPWLMIHTSGSTGNSKLVTLKHGFTTAVDAFHLLEGNDSARFANYRIFVPFPPFHIAGLTYTLSVTCYYDCTLVLPPAGSPLTAEVAHAMQQATLVEQFVIVPSVAIDLTKKPEFLEALRSLKGLTFAGGALSQEAAELISTRTRLSSGYGASEYGSLLTLPRDPEDWQYFKFCEVGGGIDFQKTDQPGLFELVLVRRSNAIELTQSIFVNFPELDEFHSRDLFSRHLTKPGLWKYETRLDDILILSNGENLNPVPMEGIITSCPDVKGAIVVGQERMQTSLLLEPTNDDISDEELMKSVQSFIERANKACPTYGKIDKDLVMRVPPGNPFARAPKGTIQRPKNLIMFKEQIDALYARFNGAVETTSEKASHIEISGDVEQTIRDFIHSELGIKNVDGQYDLFALGVDSLMGHHSNQTYQQRASVDGLVQALKSGARAKGYSDFDSDDEDDKATWTEMEKYFQDLRKEAPGYSEKASKPRNVLRSNRPAPIYQPDGGTVAWLQVLGAFLINLSNWGIVNSFGVYQEYYSSTLLASHSPSSISWIGTVQGALLLIVGVISGPLFDRGYFRTILIGVGFLLVIGLMLLSLATSYYQIMLCQGILIGLCLGLLYIPSVALMPLYFKNRRGLALGRATGGGSVGGIIYSIIFRRLIESAGFGWANRVIGFIVLITLAIAVALIRPTGTRSVRQLLDTSAFRDLPSVTFLFAAFFLFAGVLVPFFLATSFAVSSWSISGDLPFYFLAVLNASQLVGRVVSGALSDHTGPEILLLGGQISAGIIGFCWIAVKSEAGFIVRVIVYGFASGLIVTLPAAVLPYICPSLAVVGTRLGMVYAAAGLGFLMSTPIALAANASSGGFLGAQIWTGACIVVGLMFYTITCREAWTRRRLYESRKIRSV